MAKKSMVPISPLAIKKAMRGIGLDQKTLASKAGLNANTISRALKDEETSYETLTMISNVLKVQPFSLLASPVVAEGDLTLEFYSYMRGCALAWLKDHGYAV